MSEKVPLTPREPYELNRSQLSGIEQIFFASNAAGTFGNFPGTIMTQQGTPEWHQERLGKATASRIADIVARTKTGWGASRANYATELIVERLTGQPFPSYMSDAMRNGLELEPKARGAYEMVSLCEVKEVGFVPHPFITESGASPDGLVGDDGLVEIKCPQGTAHLQAVEGRKIKEEYLLQMQWQMACTGRQWCDFVSFNPNFPAGLQLFVQRVPRNDAQVKQLETEVQQFLSEVDARVTALKANHK